MVYMRGSTWKNIWLETSFVLTVVWLRTMNKYDTEDTCIFNRCKGVWFSVMVECPTASFYTKYVHSSGVDLQGDKEFSTVTRKKKFTGCDLIRAFCFTL